MEVDQSKKLLWIHGKSNAFHGNMRCGQNLQTTIVGGDFFACEPFARAGTFFFAMSLLLVASQCIGSCRE